QETTSLTFPFSRRPKAHTVPPSGVTICCRVSIRLRSTRPSTIESGHYSIIQQSGHTRCVWIRMGQSTPRNLRNLAMPAHLRRRIKRAAAALVGRDVAVCENPGKKRSPIFNEPEYGGDRSYGLPWDAHPHAKIVVF